MPRRLSPVSFISVALLFAVTFGLILKLAPTSTTTAAILYPGPSSQQVIEALIRAGLQPDALAAAGVSSNDVSTIVNNVKTLLTDSPSDLSSADSGVATNRPNVERLERLIRGGQGTEQDLSSLATARSNLNTALSNRQTALDAIFNAGAFNLSNDQKARLSKVRANRTWEVSLEFTVVDRTDAQWLALRDALENEHIATHDGADPDEGAQELLTTARADTTVVAAASGLLNNLAGIKAAWDIAVAP